MHTISQPTDRTFTLPELTLPCGALSTDRPEYAVDANADPPALEPIEQKIRVICRETPGTHNALLREYNHHNRQQQPGNPWESRPVDKPTVVEKIEEAIEAQRQLDQRFFDHYTDDSVLEEASPYLEQTLKDCRDKAEPDWVVERERENRESWYDMIPWDSVYTIFQSSSIGEYVKWTFSNVRFEGAVVAPAGASQEDIAREYSIDPRYVFPENTFDSKSDDPHPSDYGFELPVPMLVGRYGQKYDISFYPLIPWSGGLVCGCPFRQENPYRVACKHELAAAFRLQMADNQSSLPVDEGIDIPARCHRLIDPQYALMDVADITSPQ